jgi:hypothetical protein
MKASIQAAARRLLGIEGQQAQGWKYGITHASPDEIELNEYFTPIYPNPPNKWELISMGVGKTRLFFLWRAPADHDEGQQGGLHEN